LIWGSAGWRGRGRVGIEEKIGNQEEVVSRNLILAEAWMATRMGMPFATRSETRWTSSMVVLDSGPGLAVLLIFG